MGWSVSAWRGVVGRGVGRLASAGVGYVAAQLGKEKKKVWMCYLKG